MRFFGMCYIKNKHFVSYCIALVYLEIKAWFVYLHLGAILQWLPLYTEEVELE